MSWDLPEELKQKVILSTSFVSGGGERRGYQMKRTGVLVGNSKKRKKEKPNTY